MIRLVHSQLSRECCCDSAIRISQALSRDLLKFEGALQRLDWTEVVDTARQCRIQGSAKWSRALFRIKDRFIDVGKPAQSDPRLNKHIWGAVSIHHSVSLQIALYGQDNDKMHSFGSPIALRSVAVRVGLATGCRELSVWKRRTLLTASSMGTSADRERCYCQCTNYLSRNGCCS